MHSIMHMLDLGLAVKVARRAYQLSFIVHRLYYKSFPCTTDSETMHTDRYLKLYGSKLLKFSKGVVCKLLFL